MPSATMFDTDRQREPSRRLSSIPTKLFNVLQTFPVKIVNDKLEGKA
jgi:hypothetical protein